MFSLPQLATQISMGPDFSTMPIMELLKRISIKEATTTEDQQRAFRLRYRVYAEKNGWEQLNIKGIETDKYDSRSVIGLLQMDMSDTLLDVATLRLIKSGEKPLPFEDDIREYNIIERAAPDWPIHGHWDITCESSRWTTNAAGDDVDPRLKNANVQKALTMALIRATMLFMRRHNLPYTVMMSSERIIRLLHKRFKICLYPIVRDPSSSDPMASGTPPIMIHGQPSHPRWFAERTILTEMETAHPELGDYWRQD